MGTTMEDYNLLDFISTEKQYLILAGFYPAKLLHGRYLYILSAFVHLSISWLQFLSLVTSSYFNLSDLRKLSEIFLICMTQFAFLNKLTNLIMHKNSLRQLEALLRNPVFTRVDAEEEHLLTSHLNGGKLLAKVYRVLCFLVVLFYALFPFLDDRSGVGHKFPLPCWFPFDEERYYYQVFFFEVWSIAISATVNSSIDVLTIMTMILVTAEFKILNRRLSNIAPSSGVDDDYDNEVVMSKLRDCIIHYDEALNLVRHIEFTFSKGIFVQFFCSVMVICLTGFQMLMISFASMQFKLLVVYFSCMMCQVVMYCWYGHIVMDSSDKVASACYMSRWDKCGVEIGKSLMIIMERAKKPAVIKAGNFFILNIPTLMTILRSSYSYFAVLQRVYGNN